MILLRLFLIALIASVAHSVVVVNQVTGITKNNLHFTGTIGVGNNNLFFNFYGVDGETDASSLSQRDLIVVVGAPGRSAQYANLRGLGPLYLGNDLTLRQNDDTLTKKANVLFLDLLGSGFSFVTDGNFPTTAAAYGEQLSSAVNDFISQTTIGKSKRVHLVGESTFLRAVPSLDIDALQTVVHISGWFDFYQIGKYYGAAGIEMKLFGTSEKVTIESTFTTCYTYQRNSKFADAHSCYLTTLNYIEEKTKNANLFNVAVGANLTEHLPLVQYYFTQSSVVVAYKAPTTYLFESQSVTVQSKLFDNLAKNADITFSQFFKDYLSVRHIFITADDDFITYRKATRNWLESAVSFVDSEKFKAQNLEVLC